MKIGITGADGLLGFHLRAYLRACTQHEVRLANRQVFDDPLLLRGFVDGLDGIVHLAGVNRGSDDVVEQGNVDSARSLVNALAAVGGRPAVVFANSTHVDRDTPYGRGKRAAAGLLAGWAASVDAHFIDLVLPHVFGEFGRPFYNSVVSTFCHQLAKGLTPEIHVDGDVELVHAQDVAAHCVQRVVEGVGGQVRIEGAAMKVSALLARLQSLNDAYRAQVMPDIVKPLDMRLFNTLRSYLFPDFYPVGLQLRTDPRGSLFEAVKAHQGGQTFLSTTHPGITRGNHFHLRKVERFLVLKGKAEIRLRKLFSDEVSVFAVNGEEPCYVDMPTCHTHSITNTGTDELITLFWSNEFFDPADPDTYAEMVTS
jgi:UDP-2-acetamido-2,6-beta-L-arabino-hexul-4-ose reductase